MRMLAGSLGLVALLTLGPEAANTAQPAEEAVERLIQQLGSRKYAEREAAARKLEAVGGPALPPLRRAARQANLEIRRRAEQLIRRIELAIEAARLLAGKRVRLVYKDTPVLDAVEDVAARTGLDVRVEGELSGLEGRTLTLDTGETTVWEALARFCRKAGLSEVSPGPMPGTDLAEGVVRVTDGLALPLPTHLAGALRIRARPARGMPPDEAPMAGFVLEASPEPAMPWYGVAGVRLGRAVDEHRQELVRRSPTGSGTPVSEPPAERPSVWDAVSGAPVATGDRHTLPVWLTAGKKPSARLKEVRGVLTIQVPVVRELLTVDGIETAEGKTFEGDQGRSLKVLKVRRAGGALTLRVQVRPNGLGTAGITPFQVVRTPRGRLVMRGQQGEPLIAFTLEDREGTTIRPEASRRTLLPNRGGGLLLEYEVTFALKAGAAAPGRLVCRGPRLTALDIPFTLQDVPLTARGTSPKSPKPPDLPPR
jgi:hypothetical protein